MKTENAKQQRPAAPSPSRNKIPAGQTTTIRIALDRQRHGILKARARRQGVSLNELMFRALRRAIAEQRVFPKPASPSQPDCPSGNAMTWLPWSLYRPLQRFCAIHGIDPGAMIVLAVETCLRGATEDEDVLRDFVRACPAKDGH